MTVPDLFPALPDDVLRQIYEIAHLNIKELLELRLVCKYFKDAIDKYLGDRVGLIKRLIHEHNLSLKDPIYADFIQKMEAIAPFNEEIFENLKDGHLERHLTLKNLTPEKLDRTFGYMVQNREFFKQIFPAATRNDLSPEAAAKIRNYRKNYIEFVKENLFTDNKYQQFHELALSEQPFESEPGPLSLSQFQEKYAKVNRLNPFLWFENLPKMCKTLNFIHHSGLNSDPDLMDRRWQAYVVMAYAFVLDQYIITDSICRLILAYDPYIQPGNAFLLMLILSILFIRSLVSPSWYILRHIDRAIYSCPSARNYVLDAIHFSFNTLALVIMFVITMLYSLFDSLQGRLPDHVITTFRQDLQAFDLAITNERNTLIQQAQQRELRRQAALQNRES